MARPKKPAATGIIESGLENIRVTPAQSADRFLQDMALHHNLKEAAELITSHYQNIWDADHAEELELVTRELAECEEMLIALADIKQSYYELLKNTPRFIPRATLTKEQSR